METLGDSSPRGETTKSRTLIVGGSAASGAASSDSGAEDRLRAGSGASHDHDCTVLSGGGAELAFVPGGAKVAFMVRSFPIVQRPLLGCGGGRMQIVTSPVAAVRVAAATAAFFMGSPLISPTRWPTRRPAASAIDRGVTLAITTPPERIPWSFPRRLTPTGVPTVGLVTVITNPPSLSSAASGVSDRCIGFGNR